ncbi:MAG TPA: hypothetical protein VF062_10010 [Candidatus Limnocylindrales bacterium]
MKNSGLSSWKYTANALVLAVLGCAPAAGRAATCLGRIGGVWSDVQLEAVSSVVAKRAQPWLGDLATRLAERLERNPWRRDWPVVRLLVEESGITVPTSVGFVSGWVQFIERAADTDRALREDPYTATLLPMLFEHDGLGWHLEYGKFAPALLSWAAEEKATRDLLVRGCLSRLLRGGSPGDLRAYAAHYRQLAPPVDEIADRVPDFLGLLGVRLTAAAALGQQALRELDEAGRLDVETVLEASALILQRSEKKLAKAQASWLKRAAKRYPERAAELLACLEVPAAPPPEVVAQVAPVAAPMPTPIATPQELAEQLAALIAGDWSIATSESVLGGLITLRAKDNRALQDAIAPVVQAHWESLRHFAVPVVGALTAVLASMVTVPDVAGLLHNHLTLLEQRLRLREPLCKLSSQSAGLGRFMEHRLAEVATEAGRSPRPFLMATPTQANGHIDPGELVRRMEVAEAGGWQPWTIDFAQAILRVPREPANAEAERAARLHSPMGRRLAERLRDGHRDPVCTTVVQRPNTSDRGSGWIGKAPVWRKVVALEPAGEVDGFERALFTLVQYPNPEMTSWWVESWAELGAGCLPSHREVIAARLLPRLAAQADIDSGAGAARVLPLLAECHGPVGTATALAITYALAAKETADRIAGVDALLGLESIQPAVGTELAEAAVEGAIVLSRGVAALRHATASGAVVAVWAVCRAALPTLLAAEKARPGTQDLLELSQECARVLGVRGSFEELERVAARPGSSRLITEARKLRDALQV